MHQSLHLLYVPGLGDARVAGQRAAVATWRLWGVHAELIQMNWASDEPWEAKLQRLLQRIDALSASGAAVGLVGASAGASAVVNAYALRQKQVVGCVLIAGKVSHPDTIRAAYRQKNPAFVASAQQCAKALATLDPAALSRVLSRYALVDDRVPRADSHIPGGRNQVVPSFGHAITIGLQITLGAPSIIRFLRHLSPR